jgi:hypothetical protein
LSKGYLAGRYGGIPCIPKRLISPAVMTGKPANISKGTAAAMDELKQGGQHDEPGE